MPPNPAMQMGAPSWFEGAHDFTLSNPIMISNDVALETERKTMKRLEKKALVDATYNSAARHYTAPQCHPETRVSLRMRIETWLLNIDREEPLLWLYGPAGVGKSAIAQNLMEYCAMNDILATGIFLSRANKHDDPNRIIPSFSHQLAIAHPAYRRTITNILNNDPTILEKRIPDQFEQLLDKPANVLLNDDLPTSPSPILFLLDGLDECHTKSAQRELIDLVASFASRCRARHLPFACVITSRPEWQIVSAFSQLEPMAKILREELRMDTFSAVQDVERVLQADFEKIRKKTFPPGTRWPAEEKTDKIKKAASGNMLFASIVTKFTDGDDPDGQLDLCLKSIQGELTSDERNPLDPLTALYEGMLRNIPIRLLPTTLKILYLEIIVRDNRKPPMIVLTGKISAEFLDIDGPTYYACLKGLHSILSVPSDPNNSLHFTHTTFVDYVKVALREGTFGLPEAEVIKDIRVRCIDWNNKLRITKNTTKGFPFSEDIIDKVRMFSWRVLFKLWDDLILAGKPLKLQELQELRDFMFINLPRNLMVSSWWVFMIDTIQHMCNYQNENQTPVTDCVVRTTPVYQTDYELLEKYKSLIGAWGASTEAFDLTMPDSLGDLHLIFYAAADPFDDLDAARLVSKIQWLPRLRHLFLGYGENTVLVIIYSLGIRRDFYWQRVIENTMPGTSHNDILHLCSQAFDVEVYSEPVEPIIPSNSLHCTLGSFIADAQSDPLIRLKVATSILSVAPDLSAVLRSLLEYTFRDVPCEVQLVAHKVLAFLLSMNDDVTLLNFEVLEEALDLDHSTLSQAIKRLRPFIFVWSPPSNPERVFLRWQTQLYHLERRKTPLLDQACQEVFLFWIRRRTSWLPGLGVDGGRFLEYAFNAVHFIRTSSGLAIVVEELRKFPFAQFALQENELNKSRGLKVMMYQMYYLVSVIGPVVRNEPIYEEDRLLIEKWERMGHNFELQKFAISELPMSFLGCTLVSLHTDMIQSRQQYRICLIGEGQNSCLLVTWH